MRIGILTQAQEAKTRTDKASIIEQVQVDILGKQAENNSEDVFASDLEEILKKYFSNEEENIKNIVEGTTKEGEETKLISKEDSNIKIDLLEIYSGEIKKVVLAKDVLIPNENGATAEEKSPYILYNNLLCRVLYNDQEHGLQIITNDNVTDVTLGYDDPTVTADDFVYNGSLKLDDKLKKAAASFNNTVNTLNNKAKAYMGTKAIDARCLGSIATLGVDGKFQLEDISEMFYKTDSYLEEYGLSGILKNYDSNYLEDCIQIAKLKINTTNITWLASRAAHSNSANTIFEIRFIDNFSYTSRDAFGLCFVYPDGDVSQNRNTYGLRPVFLLPSDILISSGEGSLDKPYVIE